MDQKTKHFHSHAHCMCGWPRQGEKIVTFTMGRRIKATESQAEIDAMTELLKDPRTSAKARRKFRQLERERIGAQRLKTFPPVAPSRTCDGQTAQPATGA
jgi:hypothetical protein